MSATTSSSSTTGCGGTSPAGVQTAASNDYGIASFGNDYVAEDWAIARWNYLPHRRTCLNEARYQFGRDFESEFAQPPTPFEQPFAKNPDGFAPQISSGQQGTMASPLASLRRFNRAAYPDEYRSQFVDTVSWVHGKHSWKAGYDFSHVSTTPTTSITAREAMCIPRAELCLGLLRAQQLRHGLNRRRAPAVLRLRNAGSRTVDLPLYDQRLCRLSAR